MITAKIPYRVSLFGGGCDYPEYYLGRGAKVLSFAIDKYMYVSVADRFESGFRISYTETEIVESVEDIRHDLVRGALQRFEARDPLEIVTIGELPGGTGLGSSAAVTVGLVAALNYLKTGYGRYDTHLWAWDIERDAGYSPGLQDHVRCWTGGKGVIEFGDDGWATEQEIKHSFLSNFILIYTGRKRSSEPILKQQRYSPNIEYLNEIQTITKKAIDAIEWGEYDRLGLLLDTFWKLKKELADGVTTPEIDDIYQLGKDLGATGGKVCGAGGGGFMVFYVPDERQKGFIKVMEQEGYKHLPFEVGYREVR